jgi:GNAT superfamily N-acetyltransferase
MASSPPPSLGIRLFAPPDAHATAAAHARGLSHDFVTRFGEGFLAAYHRAFAASPHGAVIVADDRRTGRAVGALLGTFDTPAHYGFLVRRHGAGLAVLAASRALRDPSLAVDLARSRAGRYARGIGRAIFQGHSKTPKKRGEADQSGFLAHLVVEREYRGRGVGASLVAAYETQARNIGLRRLELATLPDERGAGPFYERLGWEYGGERVSKSGERFALYAHALAEGVDTEC